jgi:VWFA-related protein
MTLTSIPRIQIAAAMMLMAWAVSAHAQDRAQIAVREGVARNVYITATDDDGKPAKDLTAADVVVRVDGKAREVLAVAPATTAMQIVLLVDDAGPGIQFIRTAVAEFIHILQNAAEIALVSTAAQNTVLVDFTSDSGVLLAAANRLVTRSTSGGYVLDAIRESANALQRRESARPVIVLLALEGKEYSNVAKELVLDAVRRSGAIVYALSIGKPTLKTMTERNQRPTDSIHESLHETMTRDAVLVQAPRLSGGRHEQVLEVTGIQNRLGDVARELRDQLVVTYARPQSEKPPQRIDISTKRRGIKLRAPRHAS